MHGRRDLIVPYDQSETLINLVSSQEKILIPFRGGHNDLRFGCMMKLFNFILQHNGVS